MTTTIDLNLLTQINKHFASKEETRYYLNGVFLETVGDALYMVATDGARLVCAKQEGHDLGDDLKQIIPRTFIEGFKAKKGATVDVSFDNVFFTFEAGDDIRQTRAIESNFPDWRRVLPKAGYELSVAHYNPVYVKSLHDFAKAIGTTSVIAPHGENPAFVDFVKADNVFAVIMPIRAKFDPHPPFTV